MTLAFTRNATRDIGFYAQCSRERSFAEWVDRPKETAWCHLYLLVHVCEGRASTTSRIFWMRDYSSFTLVWRESGVTSLEFLIVTHFVIHGMMTKSKSRRSHAFMICDFVSTWLVSDVMCFRRDLVCVFLFFIKSSNEHRQAFEWRHTHRKTMAER